MATDKNTIKSWFEKDDRPTQAQFWAWIDSIWHKDEKIPITAIDDIEIILNDKADADAFGNHLTDANAHAELFAEPNARLDDLEAKTDSENNWKTITGYSLNPATRVLTMDAGWEGIINGIDYTNAAAVPLPAITLAAAGYSRIDLIVFNTAGTFVIVPGIETVNTPVKPAKLTNTLEATFVTVSDGVVSVPVIPKPKAPVTSVNGMRGEVVLNAINDLVTGGIYDFLSAEQGKVLKIQIDGINTLLTSNDVNLDTVQEIITAIKTVQTSLSTILVNDLTTGGTTKALTAEMGKTLKGLIDGLTTAKQAVLVSGENIKTINGITLLGGGNIITPDMDTTTAQSVSGLKTFLNNMFGFRNAANTFTSFFSNVNTASRTYTFQDRNGTLADLADIASVNTTKMNVPIGGIANYLPKFLTSTTQGLSRLWDTGTFLGIGTVNAPTKDLTFGNQANREIGVEESSNSVIGRDLVFRGGRTVNYSNGAFNVYMSSGAGAFYVLVNSINDIYISSERYTLKRTNSLGDFVAQSVPQGNEIVDCMELGMNNDIFVIKRPNLYVQYNSTGSWVLYPTPNFVGTPLAITVDKNNGDVFMSSKEGKVFKQTAGIGNFVDLNVINRYYSSMEVCLNHKFFAFSGGTIYQFNGTDFMSTPFSSGVEHSCFLSASVTNNNLYISGFINYTTNAKTLDTDTMQIVVTSSYSTSERYYTQTAPCYDGSLLLGSSSGVMYIKETALGIANLDGGTIRQIAGTGKGIGKSRYEVWTGQKVASGTDMQLETLREYIDENGYHVYTSMPVYADNAAAIAGGLPIGCEYRTATGVKMIVY